MPGIFVFIFAFALNSYNPFLHQKKWEWVGGLVFCNSTYYFFAFVITIYHQFSSRMKQTILVTDVSLNATIISLETFSIIHKKAISSKEASIRSETFLSHWTRHKIWSQTLQPTVVSADLFGL